MSVAAVDNLARRYGLLVGAMGIQPGTRLGPAIKGSIVELAKRLDDDELRLAARLINYAYLRDSPATAGFDATYRLRVRSGRANSG